LIGGKVYILKNFILICKTTSKLLSCLSPDKKKVCISLLKNAIENTPDEGKIEVNGQCKDNEIRIDVHDYGVGITSQNQKMIFGGFFHTRGYGYLPR